MDSLFVLDTVGETTALEDRAVPKLHRKKAKSVVGLLEPATTSAAKLSTTLHRGGSTAEHYDDDDEDDEDADFGDFPRATCLVDLSHLIPEPPPKPRDPLRVDMDKFSQLLALQRAKRPLGVGSSDATPVEDYINETTESLARTDVEREMKDCTNADMESSEALPNPSEKNKAKLRKLEASKTKGKNWFNMPATELTEEVQRDLEVIQMRSVLDPKHFYKKNDLKALPKYFQVGKVLSSPLDHYNERGQRTSKKKTIVDELMADAQFQKFNKRKYTETVAEKKPGGYHKAHSKMKKLKKNK